MLLKRAADVCLRPGNLDEDKIRNHVTPIILSSQKVCLWFPNNISTFLFRVGNALRATSIIHLSCSSSCASSISSSLLHPFIPAPLSVSWKLNIMNTYRVLCNRMKGSFLGRGVLRHFLIILCLRKAKELLPLRFAAHSCTMQLSFWIHTMHSVFNLARHRFTNL